MKKTLFIVLLFAAASAGVFANGSKDETDDWGPRRDQRVEEAEEISLTGTLVIEDSGFAGIESDGEVYWLMYPRWAADDLDLAEGEEISVEGYLMEGMARWGDSDDLHIRVEKAIIDGEVYDVADYVDYGNRSRMPRGRMQGRGWGRDDRGGDGQQDRRRS